MDSSDLIRWLPYLLSPLIGFMVWLYKQHDSYTEELGRRISMIEQTRLVNTLMLENMKEDISEIKVSVTKLIERRRSVANKR